MAEGGNGYSRELESPPEDAISRVRFSPHSNKLLVSSWDSTVRLYDVDENVLRAKFPHPTQPMDCCFLDDSCGLSGGSDGTVRRYNFGTEMEDILGKHDALVNCVEFAPCTGQIMTGSWDKTLRFWDARIDGRNSVDKYVQSDAVECLSLAGYYLVVDEAGYAVGSVEGRIALEFFDLSETAQENKYAFRCHPKSKNGKYYLIAVNAIEFHPSDGIFVTGDNEGYCIVWDRKRKKRLYEYTQYPSSLASLSYNRDGQLLAVAASYSYQESEKVNDIAHIFIENAPQTNQFIDS